MRGLYRSFIILAGVMWVPVSGAFAVINPPDISYPTALSVVDRFLEDWRSRKQDDAIELCSPRLKKRVKEEQLRNYVSGLSNPHHEGYEVSSGKHLGHHRVSFKVRLYEVYTGYPNDNLPPASEIIAVQDKDGKWSIDRLP